MKSLITITAGTVALIGGIATAFADIAVVDHSGQTSALSVRDQKALDACAGAFFARIAPGSTAKAHVSVPPMVGPTRSYLRQGFVLEVTMEARTASHALLARSTCEVNYEAKVTHLTTSVPNPSMLAGLAPKDIHLGIVGNL